MDMTANKLSVSSRESWLKSIWSSMTEVSSAVSPPLGQVRTVTIIAARIWLCEVVGSAEGRLVPPCFITRHDTDQVIPVFRR